MRKKLDENLIIVKESVLCTGHKVFHAESRETLAYGEGKTKKEAIEDLKKRA